jgi:hypothetical protein
MKLAGEKTTMERIELADSDGGDLRLPIRLPSRWCTSGGGIDRGLGDADPRFNATVASPTRAHAHAIMASLSDGRAEPGRHGDGGGAALAMWGMAVAGRSCWGGGRGASERIAAVPFASMPQAGRFTGATTNRRESASAVDPTGKDAGGGRLTTR